jgi:DNA primase catalytic core
MPHKDNNKSLKSNNSGKKYFISDSDLQLIHDVPIRDVIEKHVSLKQEGHRYKACCPFHQENTPSFTVFPNTESFHCFGCGASGDSIAFVMKMKNFTFPEACQEIASDHGIAIAQEAVSNEEAPERQSREEIYNINTWAANWFEKQLTEPDGNRARDYLKQRDINQESIGLFCLGYAPAGWTTLIDSADKAGYSTDQLMKAGLIKKAEGKERLFDFFRDRIIFPIHDHHGRIAGFSGRTLYGTGFEDTAHRSNEPPAKYLNSPETLTYHKSELLYGFHVARRSIRDRRGVYLVEGNTDVIRLHQIGITNTVAPCGKSLTPVHIEKLKKLTSLITIMYDSDLNGSGQEAAHKTGEAIIAAGIPCYRITLPDDMGTKSDPDSFFMGRDNQAFLDYESSIEPKDYILQFAVNSKKGAKEPDQLSRLVSEIQSMVGYLPDDIHQFYFDELGKIIPPKSLWKPRNGKIKHNPPSGIMMTDNQGRVNDPDDEKRLKEIHDFYFIEKDRELQFKGIRIDRVNFIEKLKGMGFLRFDTDIDSCSFVQAINNTLREVSTTVITDHFLEFVENIEGYQHVWDGGSKFVDNFILKRKIYDGIDTYFSNSLLKRLKPDQPIRIKRDTRNEKFLFYQNGFTTVTSDGYSFHEYNDLDQYIWSNQMLNRNFISTETDLDRPSIYQRFIYNICNKNDERFLAMQTIIGYTLHNYMDCKLWAIILTDSRISEDGEANGRTGKTLWGKALGHMLNTDEKGSVYKELNGKDFTPKNKFKFEEANLDTQLIHINDIYNDYNIENSFNDISEGIKVDKKNEKPIRIRPKFIFSTNKTIIIEGESAKDRVIQFEFADYYNSEFSPIQDFGTVNSDGKLVPHYFFTDWDDQEWARFDYFMIRCINLYFIHGIIRPAEINLSKRNLIDHTSDEFLKFMEDAMSENGISLNQEENGLTSVVEFRIGNGMPFSKKTAFNVFVKLNSDFNNHRFKQRSFTRWLRMFAKKNKYDFSEHRSNSTDFFTMIW